MIFFLSEWNIQDTYYNMSVTDGELQMILREAATTQHDSEAMT